MKIETKYNFGDLVYIINQGSKNDFIPCETCLGTGKITIMPVNKEKTCTDCYGRCGRTKWYQDKWGLYENGMRTQFIGLDKVARIVFKTTRDEKTRCYFCKNKCLRTFIDVATEEKAIPYVKDLSIEFPK